MNSNDADITAGAWLARLDRDNPSPQDLAAFEQWKCANPRHGAAYARLAATWHALDRLQAIRPGTGEPIHNDYLNITTSQVPSVPSHHRPFYRSRVFFAVAASVLVALASLWVVHGMDRWQTFTTGIGGFQRIALEDHSAILLNTDSEVRVAFNKRLRKVELVGGEASFEVAHDSSRPFIVFAGNTAVRAVGTKFDVYRLRGGVEITVDEGKVALGSRSLVNVKFDALPIAISAGQNAITGGNGVEVKSLRPSDLDRKLAWQHRMLVFDGQTLAEVIAQFNRYNDRQLVISDPKLAILQIGGDFRPTNLDTFVGLLQSDFGIRVEIDGNRLMLAASPVE